MKCQFIVAGAISAVITSGLAGTICAESTKDAAL